MAVQEVKVAQKGKPMISLDEAGNVFKNREAEAVTVFLESCQTDADAWFYLGIQPTREKIAQVKPATKEDMSSLIERTERELAKVWVRAQIGSLRGRPRRISKDEILEEFLRRKGFK